MPYFSGPNGTIHVEDAGDRFRAAYKESRLASLLGEAHTAPKEKRSGLLGLIAGIDPQAAQQMDARFSRMNEEQARQLTDYGKIASAAWKAGNKQMAQSIYSRMLPIAKAVYPGFEASDTLDDSIVGVFDQLPGATEKPSDVQSFEYFTKDIAPDQVAQARLIKLGLVSKPEQPKYDVREFGGKLYYIPQQPSSTANEPQKDAFSTHLGPLLGREGGYVANDAGAGPTNFGINSRANPDVDVRNLTPEAASKLYRDRYWNAINGDSLPAGLQAGAFDAAVNMGPARALQLIEQSGGDPEAFDQLRLDHYERLARENPEKYGKYLPAWRKRVADTKAMGGFTQSFEDSFNASLPAGAIPVAGLPDVPSRAKDAPSGYQWNPDGTLSPIPGGPADRKNNPATSDLSKGEMGMRKELQDRVKQDKSVMAMYQNVLNAAKSGTAPGDLSMIFAYMKMLDPGSVVREQEFANAQNAAGIPDRILNIRNQILSGNRLNPTQRQQFIAEAQQLANEAQSRITSATREYQGIAEQYGYDTTRATGMPDFRNVTSQPSGPQTSIDDLVKKYRGK